MNSNVGPLPTGTPTNQIEPRPQTQRSEVDPLKMIGASIRAQEAAVAERAIEADRLIEKSTTQELHDLMIRVVDELKTRQSKLTARIGTGPLPHLPFSVEVAAPKKFIRLVPVSDKDKAGNLWRVILIGAHTNHGPLGIEIGRDAIVGRAGTDFKPDIDLTLYGAEKEGVSRRHAILRPTPTSLVVADLGSTNGTYHNQTRIPFGSDQPLKDNDILSFGELHMRVKIVSSPGGQSPG